MVLEKECQPSKGEELLTGAGPKAEKNSLHRLLTGKESKEARICPRI